MTPAKLQEITLSMFTVWHNSGTEYNPDTLRIPASFTPVNEPVPFEFQGKRYLITLVKKNMWETLYRITKATPDKPSKRLISIPKFQQAFYAHAHTLNLSPSDLARSLGFASLSHIAPLYHTKNTTLWSHADRCAKAFGDDSFILSEPTITAALPECKPFKGQKLYVCRSEFQRLTGYPYNAKTEIAHLLGFKSASAIAELFEKDDRPYLTAYAHHLAEQLGEAVLWHPVRKTA
jgi:hypothetical protein